MGEQVDRVLVNVPSGHPIYAYGAQIPGEMFALVVFRCPSCGTSGEADSWCENHSAPMECVGESLRVRREPVLVPHAGPERSVTETYRRESTDG